MATRDVTGFDVNGELDAGPMPSVRLHKESNLRAFRLSSENETNASSIEIQSSLARLRAASCDSVAD